MAHGNSSMHGGTETGFQLYRASRLEALIPPLWALLDQTWPDNILSPHTVIAAHPGMKQWLTGALARHQGARGIVYGRNVIQHPDPAGMTRALMAVVHEVASPETALAMIGGK